MKRYDILRAVGEGMFGSVLKVCVEFRITQAPVAVTHPRTPLLFLFRILGRHEEERGGSGHQKDEA